jgi:hypothetical protein
MRLIWASFLVVLGFLLAGGSQGDDTVLTPAKKDHWAWRKPVRPKVPQVKDTGWVRNPIDAFVLARLEAAGLKPTAPATREQLLRRVSFDLIGLPPTPQEVEGFVRDDSPQAWEKVVDRLLASPHHGERWGRHWLDLARFAESNGYEFDEVRPDAWRYRDYVIQAFNEDKPYDRFLMEQIAGDELFPEESAALVATGFNLLGPDMTDASNQAQRRQNTLDDMTDTAGLVFLGMTIGCARCHDHKFEPILQTDFYRVQAFFAPAQFRKDVPVGSPETRLAFAKRDKEYKERIEPVTGQIAQLEEPYRKRFYEAKLANLAEAAQIAHRTPVEKRTKEQKELVENTARRLIVTTNQIHEAFTPAEQARLQELQKELKKFDTFKPPPMPVAMGLKEGPLAKTFLLARGELGQPREEVQPGWPLILSPGFSESKVKISPESTGSGRRSALARWIASPENPMTARVMVNRLWQHHFGRGIVGTPNEFGVHGSLPTHPELLDWLATEFVHEGWSLKKMHRLMLLSATYQQSTRAAAQTLAKDPENELFSRMNRQRLEGEIVRDSLLAVSGHLERKMGGPGVFPPLPGDTVLKEWKVSPDPKDHVRRSVYIFARRNLRFPFLETFDLPDSNLSCPKREQSTTAPQALALLNAKDVVTAANKLAQRVEKEASSPQDRIVLAYRLVLGRGPTPREEEVAREFLQESPMSELCRALFNLNEFVYLD